MNTRDTGLHGVRAALELITTMVLLAAAGAVLFDRTGGVRAARGSARPVAEELPLPADPVSLEGAALEGNASARVVLLEFAEFQCPYCLRFAQDTLPALAAKYIDTGRVRFAFRHFPLENIHQQALGASEAAACAGRQGRFWDMHDSIFQRSAQLAEATLLGRADDLGLDMEAFRACLAGQATAQVRRDQALGRTLGVRGTPAFLAGIVLEDGTLRVTQRIQGARGVAEFETMLDAVLASVESGPGR
jgi:protein-disulfide isomerase